MKITLILISGAKAQKERDGQVGHAEGSDVD
jgi:hypothetical protein